MFFFILHELLFCKIQFEFLQNNLVRFGRRTLVGSRMEVLATRPPAPPAPPPPASPSVPSARFELVAPSSGARLASDVRPLERPQVPPPAYTCVGPHHNDLGNKKVGTSMIVESVALQVRSPPTPFFPSLSPRPLPSSLRPLLLHMPLTAHCPPRPSRLSHFFCFVIALEFFVIDALV